MSRKMLLIEDEDDLRTLLEEYLKDNGLFVVSFASADKAYVYWSNHKDEIDLVLSDIRMPGAIDGIGLAREIRAHPGHQPEIVMISGFETPPKAMLDELGIKDFVAKPFRILELSKLCQNKLGRP